jgi:hypothetical protein
MLRPFESGGLAGRGAASLAGHDSPSEAVKLPLGFRRAVEVAPVDGNQQLPEPRNRGFLWPAVHNHASGGRHDALHADYLPRICRASGLQRPCRLLDTP